MNVIKGVSKKSIKRKSFFIKKKKKDGDEFDEGAEKGIFQTLVTDESDTVIFPIRIMFYLNEVNFESNPSLNKGFLYFAWTLDHGITGNSTNIEIRKTPSFVPCSYDWLKFFTNICCDISNQTFVEKILRLTFKFRSQSENMNEDQILGSIDINLIDYVSATTSSLNVYNNVVLYFNNENNKFLQNIKCSILSRSLLNRTPLSATSKIEEETIELNSEAEEKFSQNQIEIQHQKIIYNYFIKEIGILTNFNLKKKRKTNEKNESGSEEDSESIEDDEDDEIKKLKEALTK